MMDRNVIDSKNSFGDALTGVWHNSQLSEVFFSAANMRLLQNEMKVGVYKMSNKQFVICEQSYDSLKIIMRAIGKGRPRKIDDSLITLGVLSLINRKRQIPAAKQVRNVGGKDLGTASLQVQGLSQNARRHT